MDHFFANPNALPKEFEIKCTTDNANAKLKERIAHTQ